MNFSPKAIFVDKDGTLVHDVEHNVDPARTELLPNAAEGLRHFQALGYRIVIVTNQPGVGLGLFSEADLLNLRSHLEKILLQEKLELAGFYYCPHHPQARIKPFKRECDCRKPAGGLLLQAACELAINLSESWMAGDILDDVEAGHAAGCRSIFIDNGHETEWQLTINRTPDLIAPDLLQASLMVDKFFAEALP